MADDVTTDALVEAVVQAADAAMLRGDTAAVLSPESRARLELRAVLDRAGVTAEDIGNAAQSLSYAGDPMMWRVAALLRALAGVQTDG